MRRTTSKRSSRRVSKPAKYRLPEGVQIDYKNPELLRKFITDRGKLLSRRITGVTAKAQRSLTTAVKRARFLGLLSVGSAKRK